MPTLPKQGDFFSDDREKNPAQEGCALHPHSLHITNQIEINSIPIMPKHGYFISF
ncbi:hypothetical protein [Allofranklinella schreckenbergeri]|uniref:hypothetical protein n=1 Tax=Allofranklinella schreckenbergeri TaxID=1076744 RepID=UPI001EEF1334|nr:hypothetical protein [Allofranklinella schreckenbergeri]